MGRTCAVPRGLAGHCNKYFNAFKSVTVLLIFSVLFILYNNILLPDKKHLKHGYVYEFPNKTVVYPGVFLANRTVSCFPQTAITVQSGGRLGNQILEYASVWAMAKLYGLKAFAPETMTNRLKDVFESLNIPTTQEFVKKEVPCWETKDAVTDADVIGALERMDQNVYSLDDIVDISKRSNRFIVLQRYNKLVEALVVTAGELREEFRYNPWLVVGAQTILASIADQMGSTDHSVQQAKCTAAGEMSQEFRYKPTLVTEEHTEVAGSMCYRVYNILAKALVITAGELRQEFPYKPELVAWAQTILASIADQMGSTEHSVQKVIFVGVHVRRTDYAAQLRLVYTANAQAGVDYYRRAVHWMRSSLSKDAGQEVNVAFVVASDDPAWCLQVLIPALKREAARVSDGLEQFDVFWGGQGDLTTPEQDLVLLSSCNHSIFAYGTFGLWSALMAGGKTVVYNITASAGNRHIIGYTPAMQFATHMENWDAPYQPVKLESPTEILPSIAIEEDVLDMKDEPGIPHDMVISRDDSDECNTDNKNNNLRYGSDADLMSLCDE